MAIYRIKVTLTDNPEIYRLIDIKPEDNLEKLHRIILKSVKFEEGELAAFYVNYKDKKKQIEICLTDMDNEEPGGLLMKSVKIKEHLKKTNDSLIYIYDFLTMWTFNVLLEKVLDKPTTGTKYPAIIKSVGQSPVQYDTEEDIYADNLSEEDLMMISDMMASKKPFNPKELDEDLDAVSNGFLHFDEDEEDDFREDQYSNGFGGYNDDDDY